MALTHSQKKYIKNNIRSESLSSIASQLGIAKEDILAYLKDHWREDKYNKFVENLNTDTRTPTLVETPSSGPWYKDPFHIGSLVVFILLIGIAYVNSLNAVFLSDDISGISQNPLIGDIQNVLSQRLGFLRPLIYYVVYKIGGLTPAYFRLTNIVFHIGATFMVYLLFSRLINKNYALWLGALFAVHPILTESITWISGGGYAQYSFFFLFSFYCYVISNKGKYYITSIVGYILALLSAPTAVPLSLIYAVYEFTFGNIYKNWKRLVPYFALSAFWVLNAFTTINERLSIQQTTYYQEKGTDNPLLQIPIAISSYIYLTLWPDKLTLYHSELSFNILAFLLRLAVTLIFIFSSIYFFKKNKLIFFFQAFFIISLLLTLTPLRISWIVAERYAYLGSVGLLFIFSYGIYYFMHKYKLQSAIPLVFVVLIVAFMSRTVMRNVDWLNEDNLWISTGVNSPSSPNTHNNLGDVYVRRAEYDKAEAAFKRAIELKPNYADAYHNLANTYLRMGKTGQAYEYYNKALEINPSLWQSHQNIAEIHFQMKEFKKAEESIQNAIKIFPTSAGLYTNLAIVQAQQNKKEEAIASLRKALSYDPSYADANTLLKRYTSGN